jgi:hypothetical protein
MGELNKVVVNCRVGVELLSSVDRVGVELLSIAVVTVSSCCLVLSKCERYRYKSVVCVYVCVKPIPLYSGYRDRCRQCEAVSATTLSSSLIA